MHGESVKGPQCINSWPATQWCDDKISMQRIQD